MGPVELKQRAAKTLDVFMGMKRAMCEKHHGPADLPACLVVIEVGKPNVVVSLGHDHPLANVSTAWAAILENHTPDAVLLFSEGYAAATAREVRPGDLADAYRNDPGTDVREVLTIDAVDIETGRQVSGGVLFSVGDGGGPVFDEPTLEELPAGEDHGRIPAVMSLLRDATAYRQRK